MIVHPYFESLLAWDSARRQHMLPRSKIEPVTVVSALDAEPVTSYGAELGDLLRRSASHVDRILKGVRPGELPIEQPVKFELLVNLKVARELGIAIPQSLLLRANWVIDP